LEGGEIEAIDERKDLCIVSRPNHGVPPPKLARNYEIRTNDRIFIVGGPLGIFPVTSEGRVIRPKTKGFPVVNLNGRLLINAAGTHGNSGGPVFNENGEVIGVVMAKTSPYDHVLFCVTIEDIEEFLRENGE
jgi:serine protease Do